MKVITGSVSTQEKKSVLKFKTDREDGTRTLTAKQMAMKRRQALAVKYGAR